MKKAKKQKAAVTLIEIMIVILLIGLIGGALAFNMRGSMDKGRAFKTEQNIARVYDALMMEYARGDLSLDDIVKQHPAIVGRSPFIKDSAQVLRDGWGQDLSIRLNSAGNDLEITSLELTRWQTAHGR